MYFEDRVTDNDKNIIRVITLDEDLESFLVNSLSKSDIGVALNIPAQISQQILTKLKNEMDKCIQAGYKKTAILCNPRIRLYFYRLIERDFRGTRVISYAEIVPGFKIQVMGTISIKIF